MFTSTRQKHVCCGERVLHYSPGSLKRGFEFRQVPVSKAAFVTNNQDGGENARDECTAPHLVVGDGDELEVALLGPAAYDLGERVRQPHLRFVVTKKSNRQQRGNVSKTSIRTTRSWTIQEDGYVQTSPRGLNVDTQQATQSTPSPSHMCNLALREGKPRDKSQEKRESSRAH